jgi:DNA-binding response OmpR family regulator
MALNNDSHILLVDDNEDILMMLKAMLGLKGFKVSATGDVEAIESTIRNVGPDIILMDMLLGGYDGKEICKQLKASEEFAPIPVVMLSAHPNGKTECLQAGADYFLEKPFEMEKLFGIFSDI